MSVAILVQPASTWRPYVQPVPKPANMARRAEPERDWEDLAADEDWPGAILEYLRKNWRGRHLLWHVINTVVAESRPEARSLVRRSSREALMAMMQLIRERRVMRHRRRWVACLERLQAGDYVAGIRLLRLVLRVRPNDAGALQNLGMALSDQGQLDEAIVLLRRAAEINPSSANTQVALGVAYSRKGDTQQSFKALETAVQLDPENPYALRNLAGSLLKQGQELPRAERCFRQALVALPNDQLSWLGLGQVLETQERVDDADDAYRRALELNPHSELAESAKQGRSRIAERNMRKAAVGGLRMDAVMYCAGALEKIASMSDQEIQKIAVEIATVGMNGINPNDSKKRYRLKSLPGEFSGLQLLSYFYVTWKRFKPEMDIGFDLSKEYATALSMQKKS